MDWWEWLIIAGAIALPLTLAGIWVVRKTIRGRAILQLSFRQKLVFGRALIRDRETPLVARGLLALLVGYLVLPFDLIPDVLPFVGHLDDLLVVALVVGLVMRLVPAERIDAAIAVARRPEPVP